MNRERSWSFFAKRTFGFLIDTLLFITVFTILTRIFNLFVPGSDVRESAMQFYTEKDFNVFAATSISAMILLATYMFFSYRSLRGQTIGHRLSGVRISSRHKKSLDLLSVFRIMGTTWLRVIILIVPGPFVAYFGGALIYSLFFLIWGALIILPIPVSKTSKVTLWEKLGGYHFTPNVKD